MIGFPLDSHVVYDESGIPSYDRAVSSAPLRELIKRLFSDGVMPDSTSMKISAKTGMTLEAHRGFAICNGCMKLLETEEAITIAPADSAYPRIDKIVLRLDDNADARSCEIAVKKGTPSASPKSLDVNRTATVWEIALADVLVKANATAITNADITDLRFDSRVCGVISSLSEFDTTTLYQQIQSDMDRFKENEQTEFFEWFENIRGQLSVDAAGNLQNQINIEKARINELVAQPSVEGTEKTELAFCGTKTECLDINVISNGICAEIYIRNLKWISNTTGTSDIIAVFPEELIPMTQATSASGEMHVLYEANDIKIGVRENKLRVYRKEGGVIATHRCMFSYALKNPVMTELSDLRIDINGESHKSAGDAVREQFLNLKENVDKNEAEMKNAISMIDSFEDEKYEVIDVFLRSTKVDASKTTSSVQVGHVIRSNDFMYPEYYGKVPGEYVHIQSVEKGDYLVLANGYSFIPESSKLNMLVTDKDYKVTKLVPFEDLNESRTYLVEEDGYLYISCGYGNATPETKLFSIKTQKKLNAPLVLDVYMTATYSVDPQYGDRALEAILAGRQILVKVPNKNGEVIYNNFMPVFQYQLPNANNNYLTLFYLKDGIAENLMTAMATQSFDGVFGEITMMLSKSYKKCPLEG